LREFVLTIRSSTGIPFHRARCLPGDSANNIPIRSPAGNKDGGDGTGGAGGNGGNASVSGSGGNGGTGVAFSSAVGVAAGVRLAAVDLRSWLTRRTTESAQEKADRMLGQDSPTWPASDAGVRRR
jgi:hypothetical protein